MGVLQAKGVGRPRRTEGCAATQGAPRAGEIGVQNGGLVRPSFILGPRAGIEGFTCGAVGAQFVLWKNGFRSETSVRAGRRRSSCGKLMESRGPSSVTGRRDRLWNPDVRGLSGGAGTVRNRLQNSKMCTLSAICSKSLKKAYFFTLRNSAFRNSSGGGGTIKKM